MRTTAVLLILAASALSIQVTYPTATEGWVTGSSINNLMWESVSTDASNFSVWLTNQDTTIMSSPLLLAALVQTSDGSTTLGEPSAGWIAGEGFRLNLCRDSQSPDSILAQSPEFLINKTASSTPSSTSTTFISTQSNIDATTTDTDAPATTSNGALSIGIAQVGFMSAVALLGALLA